MQNYNKIVFTPAQLQAFDDLLTPLEALVAPFPVPENEKSTYSKPPEDAKAWMENMLIRVQQNLNLMPRDYDPNVIQNSLKFSSDVAPRVLRLQRILGRITDADFLAHSDAFKNLLDGRSQLQKGGVTGVDDNLSEGMAHYFNRSKHTKPPQPKA